MFVAMAPALGAAGLVLVGLVASELGEPLAGPWGVAVLLAVAAAGWAAALVRSRAGRG